MADRHACFPGDDLAIERRGGVIRSAMPSKRNAKDRAAEQADFLADAVAALQRDQVAGPSTLQIRIQQAADRELPDEF